MARSEFLAALCLASGLVASPALAQDATGDNQVKVTLQPYVWVPTLNGSARIGEIGAPVHVVPKDFVEGIQIGGMGSFKVEKGGHFIYADAIVVSYDNRTFRPFFEQPLRAQIRYLEFGVGLTRSLHLNEHSVVTLSPQFGVQHLYLKADVSGSLIVAKADGKWWSPSAGLTASLPVTDRLSAVVSANAAGFGLGRTNYQNGSVALQYRLGRGWDVTAGYRTAKGKYVSPGGLSIDLHGSGPVVAIAHSLNLSN